MKIVHFISPPRSDLQAYTLLAAIGVALDQNAGLRADAVNE
jgi:hypothetical protein